MKRIAFLVFVGFALQLFAAEPVAQLLLQTEIKSTSPISTKPTLTIVVSVQDPTKVLRGESFFEELVATETDPSPENWSS